MRYLLCCSVLVFVLGLQAEEAVDKTSTSGGSSAIFDEKFNSSAKDYAGFTVGVGVNVGVHEINVEANREFEAPTRFRVATLGGTVAFGYQQVVCGNCFVGIEVGADIGGTERRACLGGKIKSGSLMAAAYRGDYSEKEGILRQMFDNIATSPNALGDDYHVITLAGSHIINVGVYGRFIQAMRYLGGTGDFSLGNHNNFMTSPAGNGVFNGAYLANPDAVFADFIGERALINIENLANGDSQGGYNVIREFMGSNFPTIADALGHMAEQLIIADDDFRGPSVNPNGIADNHGTIDSGNVHWMVARELSRFFSGDYVIYEYENIGVNPAGRNIEALRQEMEDLYNPDNSYIRPQLSPAEMRALSNFQSKTSFGVCPYAAIKIGYFFKEIQGCVYAKIGITQLQGRIDVINDFMEKKDKFHTITPLVAIGVSKMLTQNCGISLELSHAPKTHKKLRDIEWKGYRVENNIGISKTDLRILFTYTF